MAQPAAAAVGPIDPSRIMQGDVSPKHRLGDCRQVPVPCARAPPKPPTLFCCLCGQYAEMARSHFIANADLLSTGHVDRTYSEGTSAGAAGGSTKEKELFSRYEPRWTRYLFCSWCELAMSRKYETAEVRETFYFESTQASGEKRKHGLLCPVTKEDKRAAQQLLQPRELTPTQIPDVIRAWYTHPSCAPPSDDAQLSCGGTSSLYGYLLMTAWRSALVQSSHDAAIMQSALQWLRHDLLVAGTATPPQVFCSMLEAGDDLLNTFVTDYTAVYRGAFPELPSAERNTLIRNNVKYAILQESMDLPEASRDWMPKGDLGSACPVVKVGRLLILWCPSSSTDVPSWLAKVRITAETGCSPPTWSDLKTSAAQLASWSKAFIDAYLSDTVSPTTKDNLVRETAKRAIYEGYELSGVDADGDDLETIAAALVEAKKAGFKL